MDTLNLLQKISVYALPILLAITVHEAAHAYAAKRFGDPTAYVLGRMTLNPLKHIDPFGTILLPLLCLAIGGFIFGWAKPVPVNFGALRNPRVGSRWVAAAGPGANLVMALIWTLFFKLALLMDNGYSEPLALMSQAGMMINVMLMALNLLPILPLDGGRILESLLPRRLAWQYSRLEPYGMWILIGLLAFGQIGGVNVLSLMLSPLVQLMYGLLNLML
ncbi:MAG: site-2 protease family protein [Paludibacterium sp.]|uniref:site-2 protease family protein n=1 Tax=Paludibacterium sp. TaxID=1917523 RepID=UPI0025E90227|nr:site-2 protease family protein [Paludibacterium sp.]MBV8047449.1 site-2 protease family protein [Paludibacterium sp.]MBV8649206.1 site-2 protease family protein [Paludibacterium sp.]